MDKNEKYLKSIDSTLKEILKELKRQAKNNSASSAHNIKISGPEGEKAEIPMHLLNTAIHDRFENE